MKSLIIAILMTGLVSCGKSVPSNGQNIIEALTTINTSEVLQNNEFREQSIVSELRIDNVKFLHDKEFFPNGLSMWRNKEGEDIDSYIHKLGATGLAHSSFIKLINSNGGFNYEPSSEDVNESCIIDVKLNYTPSGSVHFNMMEGQFRRKGHKISDQNYRFKITVNECLLIANEHEAFIIQEDLTDEITGGNWERNREWEERLYFINIKGFQWKGFSITEAEEVLSKRPYDKCYLSRDANEEVCRDEYGLN